MKTKIGEGLINLIEIILVVFFIVTAVLPIVITYTNSFMTKYEAENNYSKYVTKENVSDLHMDTLHFVKVHFVPSTWTLEQYAEVLSKTKPYLNLIKNSIILVVPILLGQLLIAPAAAYGMEYWNFKYKEALFVMYVIVMLMPMQISLVPHFIVAGWLNIRGSYLAIILPAIFHPLGVFLIRQQIKGFPNAILEAGRIDGASEWKLYTKVVCPNIVGIIAALAVVLFSDNWNIIDQAVVFIRTQIKAPMSVYLSNIWEANRGIFFAASALYSLPALIAFIFGEKYLVTELNMGAVKE